MPRAIKTFRINRKDYDKKGFVLLDDFLPEAIANELHTRYEKTDWEQIDQVRDHYKHVFSTKNPYLPKEDELYKARFQRSKTLENLEWFRSMFGKHFMPVLSDITGMKLKEFDARCYQMMEGDFYRVHIDDYAADLGIIYYGSKKWRWDWGGILHVGSDEDMDFMEPVFPKFNRLMLINHGKFRFPHFISMVTSYAQNPRYSIVAFCKE